MKEYGKYVRKCLALWEEAVGLRQPHPHNQKIHTSSLRDFADWIDGKPNQSSFHESSYRAMLCDCRLIQETLDEAPHHLEAPGVKCITRFKWAIIEKTRQVLEPLMQASVLHDWHSVVRTEKSLAYLDLSDCRDMTFKKVMELRGNPYIHMPWDHTWFDDWKVLKFDEESMTFGSDAEFLWSHFADPCVAFQGWILHDLKNSRLNHWNIPLFIGYVVMSQTEFNTMLRAESSGSITILNEGTVEMLGGIREVPPSSILAYIPIPRGFFKVKGKYSEIDERNKFINLEEEEERTNRPPFDALLDYAPK